MTEADDKRQVLRIFKSLSSITENVCTQVKSFLGARLALGLQSGGKISPWMRGVLFQVEILRVQISACEGAKKNQLKWMMVLIYGCQFENYIEAIMALVTF